MVALAGMRLGNRFIDPVSLAIRMGWSAIISGCDRLTITCLRHQRDPKSPSRRGTETPSRLRYAGRRNAGSSTVPRTENGTCIPAAPEAPGTSFLSSRPTDDRAPVETGVCGPSWSRPPMPWCQWDNGPLGQFYARKAPEIWARRTIIALARRLLIVAWRMLPRRARSTERYERPRGVPKHRGLQKKTRIQMPSTVPVPDPPRVTRRQEKAPGEGRARGVDDEHSFRLDFNHRWRPRWNLLCGACAGCAAAVVALGVAAVAQPASAAITRVTLTSTDNRNVRCPGTVHVTGTAHGTPGQPLTVTYTTAFNGKPPADILGTPVTATMPTSGVAKASYAVHVPVLTGPDDTSR